MLKKVLDYLNLRQAGGIELFFALLMILSAYSFMGVPLQGILWGLMFVMLIFKKKRRYVPAFKPLIVLITFILVHDFLYLFIANGNFNAYILQIIYFGCMLLVVNVFDLRKLRGSLNLVAVISMIGLLYQWGIIAAGGDVRPIQIPFLDMGQNRLETFSIRPSSLFMEPAAYVAFMYIPLAFSLIDKRFIWSAIIILSVFLTTSTTGILTSFIMLIAYVFSQKVSFKIRLVTILMGVAMLFSLFYVEAFQTGISKLEDTDVDTNVRLSQGPYVVSTMKSEEMIFGAPYHNAYDYCIDGHAPKAIFYKEEVYMSTIWMLLLKYGFVGLLLYSLFYYYIIKRNKQTIPLVICLIATMFSSGYGLGGIFVYTSIPLLLMSYKRMID